MGRIEKQRSQSPQIGSMFLTKNSQDCKTSPVLGELGRNPLKSGQCFLPEEYSPSY